MRFALQLAVGILLLALLWRIPVVHEILVLVLILAVVLVAAGIYLDLFRRYPKYYSKTPFEVFEAFFADAKNYDGRYIEEIVEEIGPWQDYTDWDRGKWDYRWHTKQGIFEVATQSGYVKEFRKLPLEHMGKWG